MRHGGGKRGRIAGQTRVERTSSVVVAFESACLGLVALLGVVGFAVFVGARGPMWVALHVRGADVLIAASLGLVVAGYASGVHRKSRARWWVHSSLFMAVVALYILGDAAVMDANGAAGREHIGTVLGVTPGPVLTLAAHLVGGTALVLAAIMLGRKPPASELRLGDGYHRLRVASATLVPFSAGMLALVSPLERRVPILNVATVPTPPWPALAFVPLEARMPLALALVLVILAASMLLFVPLVDRSTRPPWVRSLTTATLALILLAFLALLLVGSIVPETEHFR